MDAFLPEASPASGARPHPSSPAMQHLNPRSNSSSHSSSLRQDPCDPSGPADGPG